MYTVLTPEEASDQILAIYREHPPLPPGVGMHETVLREAWERRHLPLHDLDLGLNYTLEKGWIREDTRSGSWLLTELGTIKLTDFS